MHQFALVSLMSQTFLMTIFLYHEVGTEIKKHIAKWFLKEKHFPNRAGLNLECLSRRHGKIRQKY